MKRVLFAVAMACAMISAQASYLNWQVDDTEFNGREVVGANLYAFDSSISFDDIRNGTKSATSIDGTDQIGVTNFADLSQLTDPSSYSFYIELIGYESAQHTSPADSIVIGTSGKAMTYEQLSGAGYIGTSMDVPSIAPWVGDGYVVPEPTSGLLMMMGLALLSLKRRKE